MKNGRPQVQPGYKRLEGEKRMRIELSMTPTPERIALMAKTARRAYGSDRVYQVRMRPGGQAIPFFVGLEIRLYRFSRPKTGRMSSRLESGVYPLTPHVRERIFGSTMVDDLLQTELCNGISSWFPVAERVELGGGFSVWSGPVKGEDGKPQLEFDLSVDTAGAQPELCRMMEEWDEDYNSGFWIPAGGPLNVLRRLWGGELYKSPGLVPEPFVCPHLPDTESYALMKQRLGDKFAAPIKSMLVAIARDPYVRGQLEQQGLPPKFFEKTDQDIRTRCAPGGLGTGVQVYTVFQSYHQS